jgi:hypothetical protein
MTSTTFAGFTFPYTFAILPRGPLAKRLAEYKQTHGHKTCGPYYRNEPAMAGRDGLSFYLESDFMPDLRWEWCDEVDGVRGIDHTGWFTNEFCDDKIRGLVFRLPHGRGFLAGWSMGEHMASGLEYSVYDDAVDAAHAADSIAENMAERQREYEESQKEDEDEDISN